MINSPPDGISPGEFLLENVIKPLKLSIIGLAKSLNIPANRLYLIINNKREITEDTALRLGHYFETGPELWLFVQMKYNLKLAKEKWDKEKIYIETIDMQTITR